VLRRFGERLSGASCTYSHKKGGTNPPEAFACIVDGYVASMTAKGLRPATIRGRRLPAAQFLLSLRGQGVSSLECATAENLRNYMKAVGSRYDACAKLKPFLVHLHESGLIKTRLAYAIALPVRGRKLPAVYKKEELLSALKGIDRGWLVGKRDYAIFLMLASYGMREGDLSKLKVGNMDFQRGSFSFMQSKNRREYRAALLPAIKEALLLYLAECDHVGPETPLFQKVSAPFGYLSPSAIGSVVEARLLASVEVGDRKRGGHALRSSLTSGLIANGVPFLVVKDAIGQKDPNATKRHVAMDIEKLRECALECQPAAGAFKAFLEGGGKD
jgi:integrase